MQSTHTPGPWHVNAISRGRIIGDASVKAETYQINNRNSTIATVYRPKDCNLIAAAPAMYEALERIANHEYRTDRRHRGMIDISEIQTLERIARVALAAARGEVQA